MKTTYKREASSGTIAAVNAIWAVVMGSVMVWAIYERVLVHLLPDGLTVPEMVFIVVNVFLGLGIAFPSKAKALFADAIEAYKAWKG